MIEFMLEHNIQEFLLFSILVYFVWVVCDIQDVPENDTKMKQITLYVTIEKRSNENG